MDSSAKADFAALTSDDWFSSLFAARLGAAFLPKTVTAPFIAFVVGERATAMLVTLGTSAPASSPTVCPKTP